jgi:molybdenum cofactor synthesis domain-containing protein
MAEIIEIICIGNELLIGKIVNTNAQWLAKRITTLGLKVNRVTVIGDDLSEISIAIKEALGRKPKFVLTTGGLGPTFDDKTLQGIAQALNTPLENNPKALKMIKEKYQKYIEEGRLDEKIVLTPPRVKMAMLPKNADPLPNPVGTAPSVIIKQGDITIVALPGVPSEMEAIFDESIAPILKQVAGNVTYYETTIAIDGIMESDMAPLIDKTMHNNPYVYIKSYPDRISEGKPHLKLHLSTTASDSGIAKNRVVKALIEATELIQTKGGKTKLIKE